MVDYGSGGGLKVLFDPRADKHAAQSAYEAVQHARANVMLCLNCFDDANAHNASASDTHRAAAVRNGMWHFDQAAKILGYERLTAEGKRLIQHLEGPNQRPLLDLLDMLDDIKGGTLSANDHDAYMFSIQGELPRPEEVKGGGE